MHLHKLCIGTPPVAGHPTNCRGNYQPLLYLPATSVKINFQKTRLIKLKTKLEQE